MFVHREEGRRNLGIQPLSPAPEPGLKFAATTCSALAFLLGTRDVGIMKCQTGHQLFKVTQASWQRWQISRSRRWPVDGEGCWLKVSKRSVWCWGSHRKTWFSVISFFYCAVALPHTCAWSSRSSTIGLWFVIGWQKTSWLCGIVPRSLTSMASGGRMEKKLPSNSG